MSDTKEKPACAEPSAFPTEVTCPGCSADLEMWSDDEEVVCEACREVIKKEAVS